MNLKEIAIRLLQRAGLYVLARECFQRVNPSRRRSRRAARLFYSQLVDPDDLCFDVGANVGQTSEVLLALGARVVAVEPNPLCNPILEKRFQKDKHFTLVGAAVGAAPGKAKLNFMGTASTASIREDWPFETNDSVEVAVTTVDDLISRWGSPKLLKVDVEGFEVEVFKGLSQPLPIIYFEMNANEYNRAIQVLTRLKEIGTIQRLNVTDIDHQGWLFDEWIGYDEFVAIKVDRFPRISNVVVKMAC